MSFEDHNGFYDEEQDRQNGWQQPRQEPTPMGRRQQKRRNSWVGPAVATLLLIILTCGVIYVTFFADVHLTRAGNGFVLYVGSRTDTAEQPHADETLAAAAEPAPSETVPQTQAPETETAAEHPDVTIEDSPASPDTAVPGGESDALSLQEIYRKCIGSVVSITTSTQSGKSSGTGIVLSADGYLITNHHVIENAQVIAVQTSDDRQFQARLVGSDEASDLAVLKVDATDLQPAEFGNSSKLRVGDSVVAIGDPLGAQLRGTMTSGIVSAINRDLEVNDRTMTLIQTDAALNNGNSGGPLINCYGQVIGINTMKLRSYYSTTAEGLGFAIPMSVAKPILEELMENGYVAGRPAIGISYDTLPLAFRIYYNLPEGVYVTSVYDGSDAKAKGIAAGDIITAVNDTAVTSIDELNRIKNQFSAGDTIDLTIYRGGQYFTVGVTLIDQATGH